MVEINLYAHPAMIPVLVGFIVFLAVKTILELIP